MRQEADRPRRTAVVLDPHPLCHTALRAVLTPHNIELVGATTSIRTTHDLLREHRPDLLVLEVDLPGKRDEALETIATGRAEDPNLTVVVLSATDDRELVDAAFDRGARAYVLKSSDPQAVATGILQAFEPSLYLPGTPRERREAPVPDRALLGKLTRREVEILRLVSGGLSNRQVGEILYVTDQTVKFHLANVYRKLGVGSRLEAGRWAREQGLVDSEAVPNVVALPKGPRTRPRGTTGAVVVPLLQGAVTEAGETSR
jgi:DNA-binding NarL/FixJ family response regulator